MAISRYIQRKPESVILRLPIGKLLHTHDCTVHDGQTGELLEGVHNLQITTDTNRNAMWVDLERYLFVEPEFFGEEAITTYWQRKIPFIIESREE